MRTVASFRDISQGHLAKGRLEAEGISAILLDEFLIGIDWTYSQAVGGVKIQVSDASYEQARKILQQDYSGELESLASAPAKEICPSCGSHSIAPQRYSLWSLIPSLFFLCPVFFRKKKWRCTDCGTVW